MPTFTRERSQTFTHRAIEAFNQGGIELFASDRHVQQGLCFLTRAPRQLAGHLDDPFLLDAFDHGGNTEIGPDL